MINRKKLKLIFILTLIFSILIMNTVYASDIGEIASYDNLNNREIIEDKFLSNDALSKSSISSSDNDFNYIQGLIDKSSDGDSIYLKDKTYTGNGTAITIDKNLNIYGYGYENGKENEFSSNVMNINIKTIFDADSKSNIIITNKNVMVNLYGLALINGNTKYDEGE